MIETPIMLEVIEAAVNYKDGELLWELLLREEIRRWRKESPKITEDEWLAKIETIPDIITKTQVACIIWWDYVRVWPKFEKYLSSWKEHGIANKAQTCKALMNLGYPERMAIERVKVMK